MNSSEAATIREVALLPKEAHDAVARSRGVLHELEMVKASGKDPASLQVAGKDKSGASVKDGDLVSLPGLQVTCIHEVIDEETGAVKGHTLDLSLVKPNGFQLHLGRFDAATVVRD
jgi:hypothetical protein